MPKDWIRAYETDDTPWDKGAPSPPLREFLSRRSVSGRVLVPGCGTGHDVRLLAAQGAEVVGLDLAPGALRKAGAFAKTGGESYVLGDFLQLAPEWLGRFDWVVEHTCLCALDPEQRGAYVDAVLRALKPSGRGGVFIVRCRCHREGPPHPIGAEAIEALFAPALSFCSALCRNRPIRADRLEGGGLPAAQAVVDGPGGAANGREWTRILSRVQGARIPRWACSPTRPDDVGNREWTRMDEFLSRVQGARITVGRARRARLDGGEPRMDMNH